MDGITRRSRSPARRADYMNDGGENMSRGDTYRRRSPGGHDRRPRGNRNRSRSPPGIDRYQPGRGDDSRRDGYRRRSPPATAPNIDRYVPGQDPPAPLVNPVPNPMALEHQVGFSHFAEWWRKEQEMKDDRERRKTGQRKVSSRYKSEQEVREEREKERTQIQVAYDAYKEKHQAQMARMFVQQHKSEEWFKEKYDPPIRDPIRLRQAAYRRGVYAQWQTDLVSGVFDEFTLEGIYKNESDGAGGVVDKEEGETTAAAEILSVADLVPAKGGDLRDEAASQPALLIKTIAPHVSRDKLEVFCKENLGEGDGGFKWLSLSDANPAKKCHRIGWVLLNPAEDTVLADQPDERGDGREEEGEATRENEDGMDTTENNIVPQSVVERAQAAINGKSIENEEKGAFQCHVGIHTPQPAPRKKALWDLFSAPERIDRDLQLAVRLATKLEQELGEDVDGIAKIDERMEEIRSKGLLQPVGGKKVEKTKKALEDNDEEAEEGEEGEDTGAMDEDDEGALDDETDDEDLLTKKKKLDLLVEYLRRVFNFCLFCVFESDSVHELMRKCPAGHLRRPRASLTTAAKDTARATAFGDAFPLKKPHEAQEEQTQETEDGEAGANEKQQLYQKNNKVHQQLQKAFNWVKTYEDKLFQVLEPESADLKKIGGRPIDEAMEEELKKHVKQEDEAKFRCRVPDCTKLFKGEVFWRKHVEKRHAEWYEGLKKDFELINAYVLDPAHVTSSRSDSASNGHFPLPNNMPGGANRSFSMHNMPFPMPGMPPGMPPGMFNGFPMPIPGMNPMHNGTGPMRRGGGRFSNRAGPYDRSANNSRAMRWGHEGRTSPPSRGGMRGGRGGFLDALPGSMPKEAVAGRSLKSYQDLDAVTTQGSGQLDY